MCDLNDFAGMTVMVFARATDELKKLTGMQSRTRFGGCEKRGDFFVFGSFSKHFSWIRRIHSKEWPKKQIRSDD